METGQALCRTHRLKQDQDAFGPISEDHAALRRACHAAPDAEMLGRYYPGETLSTAPEWQDARVEITAFRLSEGSRIPIVWPWVYEQFPNIDGPCIIARWRLRYPGKPGVLRMTWDSRRRREERFRRDVVVRGLGVTPDDVAQLWRLWTTAAEAGSIEPGRSEAEPPQPRQRTRRPRWLELQQAARAARALIETTHQCPTFEAIHEYIATNYEPGLPIETLRSRWRLRGRDEPPILMPEVLEEARR